MQTDANTLRAFLLAGSAVFTLTSGSTGRRFTYRVTRAKQTGDDRRPAPWFVSLLNGPDNERDYVYAGLLTEASNGHLTMRLTAKSKVGPKADSVRGFQWMLGMLNRGLDLDGKAAVDPEGRCGRCGRALTVPESIRTGLGPECAKRAAA